jgi:hypothetical protein
MSPRLFAGGCIFLCSNSPAVEHVLIHDPNKLKAKKRCPTGLLLRLTRDTSGPKALVLIDEFVCLGFSFSGCLVAFRFQVPLYKGIRVVVMDRFNIFGFDGEPVDTLIL